MKIITYRKLKFKFLFITIWSKVKIRILLKQDAENYYILPLNCKMTEFNTHTKESIKVIEIEKGILE